MTVVLVATNGSDACRRAVGRTADLFPSASVVVATVVPGGPGPVRSEIAEMPGELTVRAIADELAVDAAEELLAEACRSLGGAARPLLLTGEPVGALVGAARASCAEALIVGSLGRPLAGVVGTSVGAALARQAPCSVIELG